jgi:hypothetical protein
MTYFICGTVSVFKLRAWTFGFFSNECFLNEGNWTGSWDILFIKSTPSVWVTIFTSLLPKSHLLNQLGELQKHLRERFWWNTLFCACTRQKTKPRHSIITWAIWDHEISCILKSGWWEPYFTCQNFMNRTWINLVARMPLLLYFHFFTSKTSYVNSFESIYYSCCSAALCTSAA